MNSHVSGDRFTDMLYYYTIKEHPPESESDGNVLTKGVSITKGGLIPLCTNQ